MPYKRFYIKAHPGDWLRKALSLSWDYLFIPAYLLHVGLGLGGG
jgi:hypothetical protein